MKKSIVFGDRLFFLNVLLIALVGFAIFASATLGFLARETSSVSKGIFIQAGFGFGIGLLAFFAARTISLAWIRKIAPYLFAASLIFTALVFVPGLGFRAGGATRW